MVIVPLPIKSAAKKLGSPANEAPSCRAYAVWPCHHSIIDTAGVLLYITPFLLQPFCPYSVGCRIARSRLDFLGMIPLSGLTLSWN